MKDAEHQLDNYYFPSPLAPCGRITDLPDYGSHAPAWELRLDALRPVLTQSVNSGSHAGGKRACETPSVGTIVSIYDLSRGTYRPADGL